MAKLFKRNGSDQWCGKVRIAPGKWRTLYLFTDKQASLAELYRRQKDADQRRAGLLTTVTDAAAKPLAEHLADFLADCQRQGYAAKHLYMLRTGFDRLTGLTGWKSLSDLNADVMRKALKRLADSGTGPATCNKYLIRAKSFCIWLVRHERLPTNPLASVAKARENPTRRQALSDQQVVTLLATAPEPGRSVYHMALLTGLRRGELRELRWGDLHLNAIRPFIQLQSQHTKNRKADVLPLHADLVTMFNAAMPGHPDTKVFSLIPGMKRFRTDLKRAGIPAEDYDFHCLRHTYCTMVVKSGCNMKEAQQLMRHSSIELTAKVYTHLGMTDIAGALDKVHIPSHTNGQSLAATGTNDVTIAPIAADETHAWTSVGGAHQMAHQTTCFSGHDKTEVCITERIDVEAHDVQETLANTGGFAIMHADASKTRGRNSAVECQLPKLDVVGSNPIARFCRWFQVKL